MITFTVFLNPKQMSIPIRPISKYSSHFIKVFPWWSQDQVALSSQVQKRGLWRKLIFHISELWLFSHFIYIHFFAPSCGRIKQFYSLEQLVHHSLNFKWNVDIKQDTLTIVMTITSFYIVLEKAFLFPLECYHYYSSFSLEKPASSFPI